MFKKFTLSDFIITLVCVAVAFFGVGALYGDRSIACIIGLITSGAIAVWYIIKIISEIKWNG